MHFEVFFILYFHIFISIVFHKLFFLFFLLRSSAHSKVLSALDAFPECTRVCAIYMLAILSFFRLLIHKLSSRSLRFQVRCFHKPPRGTPIYPVVVTFPSYLFVERKWLSPFWTYCCCSEFYYISCRFKLSCGGVFCPLQPALIILRVSETI